jgi:hypothetical protein
MQLSFGEALTQMEACKLSPMYPHPISLAHRQEALGGVHWRMVAR